MDKLFVLKYMKCEALYYMNWFSDAWGDKGVRLLLKNGNVINYVFSILPRKVKYILLFLLQVSRRKSKYLIIPMGGGTCLDDVFPFCYKYNIIPYIWDCWPNTWKNVLQMVRILHIEKCFISSSLVCNELSREMLNTQFVFVPEGINPWVYQKGDILMNREIDVLELGRKNSLYHDQIIKMDGIKFLYNRNNQYVFPSFSALVSGLSNSKIVICFPRCDTHQNMTGKIETLTQRYWECMLSRCLIVGRAPFELINLIGYNPVIEVEWGNEGEQLLRILNNIEIYQDMVDRNYSVALKFSSWAYRVNDMMKELSYFKVI
ncbi:hypothetical protein [uncultured Parabacteroides sp.]|nr:hypothetical protein [uncultured Parabacteroides sp.]MBD9166986.1 hypothetical protein [Parabacteroides johnsonii]